MNERPCGYGICMILICCDTIIGGEAFRMKGNMNKKRAVSVGIFFLFMIITYGVTSYSSTLTHSTECGDLDSYCYRYMGMLMAKGGIPYLDGFDNKGPLLYLLNCIGYLISRKFGVYIIEYIFMMLYLAVQYAIARRFSDAKRSLIYIVAALGPIGAFFLGNMTEEYALLFISIGILVFIDYFLFNKTEWYRIFICGISCGAVLMIRPNMIAVWAVFCLYAVFVNIRQKKSFPLKTFMLFISGVLVAVIPFLVWLGFNGAIEEFWKDYIVTNIYYSSEHNTIGNIFGSFISYMLESLTEIYLLLLLFLLIKKQNTGFNVAYIIYMVANILIISLSGKGFEHYGMVTLPTLVYPLAASSDLVKKQIKSRSYLFDVFALLSSVLLIGFMINNYLTTIPALISPNTDESRNERILSVIDDIEPDEKILVLGYKDYYYVESDRIASSKFHFFVSMNANYPGGLKAVTEDINNSSPKLVIIVEGFDHQYLDFDFNDYTLIDEDLNIWMRNDE